MGFFDKTLTDFGYERAEQTKGVRQKDYATSSGALGSIVGANSWNPAFSSFNNEKQQLLAYRDWVYIAARAIAEQCASVDLRLFENHTKMNNSMLGLKLIENPQKAAEYLTKKVNYYETKDGKVTYRRNAKALEELDVNPLLTLINHPNPYMVKNEFLEITFLHLELTGNAYWFIARDKKGNPIELWPLLPNGMAVVPDETHFIVGYVYTTNGKQIPLDPKDVVHHKYGNPMDFRHGYSAVMAGSTTIDADTHASIFNQRFFYNSAMPDGFLTTEESLDEKTFKRLKTEWMNTYSGSVNSHKTAILSGGLEYKNLQIAQRDMEFLKGRNFNRDMIMALFGVPKSILGFDESMSRANAETAEYVFSKRVRIKMQRLTNRITMDLAPQFGKGLIMSFTDPVPKDAKQVLDDQVQSLGGTNTVGMNTINEVRAKRGDLPIPGGDTIYIPEHMQPIGTADFELTPQGTPTEAQEEEEEGKPEENDDDVNDHKDPDEDGADDTVGSVPSSGISDGGSTTSETTTSTRSIDKPKPKMLPAFPEDIEPKSAKPMLPDFPESIMPTKAGGEEDPFLAKATQVAPLPVRTRLFTNDDVALKDFLTQRNHMYDVFEVHFLRAAKGRFDQQKAEVLSNLQARFLNGTKSVEGLTKKDTKKKLDNLFDPNASKAAWIVALMPTYKGLARAAGGLAVSLINNPETFGYDANPPEKPISYSDSSAEINKAIEERADNASTWIDGETNKQIRATISEGLNNGESLQQLSDRVEGVFSSGSMAGYRTQRIARTETQSILQETNNTVWKNSDMVESYVWICGGPNPCEICLPLNNTTKTSPDDFPDEHVNGQCSVMPMQLKDLADTV